jgi:hypothetical protein
MVNFQGKIDDFLVVLQPKINYFLVIFQGKNGGILEKCSLLCLFGAKS